MPIFQTSITSSYDSVQEAILIEDTSNYTTNTQSSHALADFDTNSYYRIQVAKPNLTTFVWSNQSGADISIPSASLNIFDSSLVLLPTDISGNYTNTIYSVPAWDALETYAVADNDTVFHNSFLWECTDAAVTTEPSIGNTDWDVVSISTLNVKYIATEVVAVDKSSSNTQGDYEGTWVDSTGTLGIVVDSNCSSIQVTDNSNYTTNGEAGHAQSDFSDYRFIEMTKPDGTLYVFSSVDFEDITVDQVINPASTGGNDFFYQFDHDIDKDGVYEFKMCNYPTWNLASSYLNEQLTVVFYNGELYKLLQASTNNLPDETASVFWELYEFTDPDDEYITRYCTCAKIAVLCLNTYDCYQRLVRDSYCSISTDFCNDDLLCNNKTLLNTVKLRILIDEVEFAVDRQAWTEVVNIFNLIHKICGCL